MRRPACLLVVTALFSVTAVVTVAAPGSAEFAADPVGGPQLGGTAPVVTAGATATPKVAAGSWLVADATTGTILAAKNAHGRFMPASTLKTLTALTLLPRLDKSAVYVGRPQDTSVEGTRVGIVAGATYTVDQLFYGLFLASGNDAASALANAGGGWAKTVAR